MADTYYAWSPIRYAAETNDQGNIIAYSTLEVGKKADAKTLGISDEDFQDLVDGGSVSTEKYPDLPDGYTDSPKNFMFDELKLAEGHLPGSVLATSLDPGEMSKHLSAQAEGREDASDNLEGKVTPTKTPPSATGGTR